MPELFADFDFTLLDSPEFKEDSVREELIVPIIRELGYRSSGPRRIVRSKRLQHPFVQIGSSQRPVEIIPDYLLLDSEKTTLVLDAKSPDEEIKSGSNRDQVYSYTIHPEIDGELFALCNGHEFALFHVRSRGTPLMCFQLSEINFHWEELVRRLNEEAASRQNTPLETRGVGVTALFDYLAVQSPKEILAINKQTASRHFGVHPYFTKQVWSVVRNYIKTFTQPGDIVLDPFGGSGVTLIEALMLGRRGIHIDLNPLACFVVENLIQPVKMADLSEEYERIEKTFKDDAPRTDEEVADALKKYPYPTGIALPKNSDVETIEQLFSPRQLAQLAFLKHHIGRIKKPAVRGTFLLMFSGLLNKINLTYHSSGTRSAGRGDSAIFRYYRYRMAPRPVELDVLKYFESRYKKVCAAKAEIAPIINAEIFQNAQVRRGTATKLSFLADESIDYIYTDPPYGAKIPYLDLSILWNSWLGLNVTEADYKQEAIEGGEHNKSKAEYSNLLAKSIEEMARVLKFGRWMSFVFAHKDPAYWHLIIDAAEKAGFEYAGCVKQNNGQTSFKKRQHPFTVLSGQLIINFRKVANPRTIGRVTLGAPVMDIVHETVEAVIALHNGATLEQINDELVIRGLEMGFLDVLAKEYTDLTPLLQADFDYDEKTQTYNLRARKKFKSHIRLELRVRYFLMSYLKRAQMEGVLPDFDEIVLNIMPLLKNGVTPEHQTILGVLESVAERTREGGWRLTAGEQATLFD